MTARIPLKQIQAIGSSDGHIVEYDSALGRWKSSDVLIADPLVIGGSMHGTPVTLDTVIGYAANVGGSDTAVGRSASATGGESVAMHIAFGACIVGHPDLEKFAQGYVPISGSMTVNQLIASMENFYSGSLGL